MKKSLYLLILVVLVSCNNKTENNTSENKKNVTETSENKVVTPKNPCDLFNTDQLVSVFDIKNASTIEMYARDQYGSKKQCQFIWTEEEGSVAGSQIMIDITSKTEDMGATFARMLELDLQNGLTARENNETIIIKPTVLENFGDFAYHWEQHSFQSVQKITFQVNNEYRVDITYNAHKSINASKDLIKSKLIAIGKTIKQNL
ncbi:hypothetical protein [Flavobacterium okayamense]|uniref:Lipoprotein n=1 Tax=Flavobacterium okayamense TaxID=2830782 RepID=A0ABM7S647_9FLAO|nr:hypothetical protein [Flavobacterium okayamense]BCY28960.1 hypothetical protein KK2020170_18280 [Flavobacterium okayamense]